MTTKNILSRATAMLLMMLLTMTAQTAWGIQILVKTLTGQTINLEVEPTDSFLSLKYQIQEKGSIPSDQQHLFFNGAYLPDDKTVGDYDIQKESMIYLAPGTIGSISINEGLSAYEIKSVANLNDLAVYVNGTGIYSTGGDAETTAHNCEGLGFKISADIAYGTEDNYTAIGNNNRPFCGHFDGLGYTINGIRINSDDDYQGLFGEIGAGAEVKGVILTDAQITGAICTGGIAGRNNGGTISGCFVQGDVIINPALGDNVTCHGGIVGNNLNKGLVSGCASKATVNGRTSGINGSENYGGVAGLNSGTIENCLYLGTTVKGKLSVGAIVGSNSNGSTVQNCYYTARNFVGKDGSGTGITFGTNNNDPAVGSNYGSTDARLAPQDTKNNTAFLALMAARNTALTKVSRTPALSTEANVTLSGHTLIKDGAWNTLCLPFDMTAAQVTEQLAPTALKTLSSTELNDNTLTLNFEDATEIVAGKPYIIKWASGSNLVNPTFTGVTVSNAAANVTTAYADFIGTYAPIVWTSKDKSILFLGVNGDKNTLYYPQPSGNQNPGINAFRAYFQLKNCTTNASAFVLNFGDDATSIKSLTPDPSPTGEGNEYWFDLSGRKLDKQPTQKGIYIHGNKKVVIK